MQRSSAGRAGDKGEKRNLKAIEFFFVRCIYLFMKTQRETQKHRQREKQSPCRESDAGLDPRPPGS